MDEFDAVIQALRERSELHVVDVAALLLRVCRSRVKDLAAALDHGNVEPYGAYVVQSRAVVPALTDTVDPEYFDEGVLKKAAEFIEAGQSPEDRIVRVRALASAIGMCRSDQFFFRFSGERCHLQAGDPVPIGPAEVIAEELGTAHGISTDPDERDFPEALAVPYDGLERLRLCPEGLGEFTPYFDARYSEAIDSMFAGESAPPTGDTVWASVVPTCSLLADLTYTAIDGGPRPEFFDVRPREQREYIDRTLKLLDAAASAGAQIIVLPELCLDEAVESNVHVWFQRQPGVALLVAGSRHLREGGSPRNRATILLRGASSTHVLSHDKFSEFDIKLDKQRFEAIDRQREIAIYSGRRWSFTTFICKDFMMEVPRRIAADLRVRAVFVPSMSPKTDQFITQAGAFAQNAHSVVFLANAPHSSADHTAILATPLRGPPTGATDQRPEGLVLTITTKLSNFSALP